MHKILVLSGTFILAHKKKGLAESSSQRCIYTGKILV